MISRGIGRHLREFAALAATRGFGAVLLGLAFSLTFVLSLRRMADTDLWGHLACGNYLLDTGRILTTHYFNCSWPAFPYVNHEWLFQAVIALVERAGGEPGLMALQVGLVLLAFFLLYRCVRMETDRPAVAAFVVALGTLASMHRFMLRPQHFTYVFLLYFLFALRQYQRGSSRPVLVLPLVMLLWVNSHAESLWGIVVLGTFLFVEWFRTRGDSVARKAWMRLLAVFGAVLIAALINPFTWRTVLWPLLVMKEQFAGVEEILPPTSLLYLYFWAYCAVFMVAAALNLKRNDPAWLVLSAGFLVIAWTANRGIPHFVFVSAPLLAGNIDCLLRDRAGRLAGARKAASWMLPGAMIALLYSIVASPLYLRKFDNIPYPDRAIAFLRAQGIHANVFNEHRWGGYIIWTSYPDLRPYIDGRFFHRTFYEEYYALLGGQAGWARMLDRYGITAAILTYSPRASGRLNDRLFSHPAWRLVYWDDHALVYLKTTPENRKATERYGTELFNVDRDAYSTFRDTPRPDVLRINEAAERNLAHASGSYTAAIVAGNSWFALGAYDQALHRYEDALKRMPAPNPGLLYQMALSHRRRGDLAETEEYLRRVLDIAPEAEHVRMLLREVRFLRSGSAGGAGRREGGGR